MGWIVRLAETGSAGRRRSVDVMEIGRPGDLAEIGDLGLSLAEGKRPPGAHSDLDRRRAEGCRNAAQLWRKLAARGFSGRLSIVRARSLGR